MIAYVVRKLLGLIPLLVATTFIVFLLLKLVPGDPVIAMLGPHGIEEHLYDHYREELGLNEPLHTQYLRWLGRVAQGDLGRSIITQQQVGLMIRQRLTATAQLVSSGFLLGILIALPVGIVAAVRRNSVFDLVSTQIAIIGTALPTFWLGMMLILLFGLRLRWLPPSGYVSPNHDLMSSIKYMLMPSVTLGLHLGTVLMRQTRSAMLTVLSKDYIRTAKAKGISNMKIISRHAVKNALVPIITVSALQIQRLIAGAVIIESVFAIPGIGRLMMDSIHTHDFPVMQGCILVLAMLIIFINVIADILFVYVNPRISYQ